MHIECNTGHPEELVVNVRDSNRVPREWILDRAGIVGGDGHDHNASRVSFMLVARKQPVEIFSTKGKYLPLPVAI